MADTHSASGNAPISERDGRTVESDADHLGTLLATRSQVLDAQVDGVGRD